MRAAISKAVLALTCAAASGVGCHQESSLSKESAAAPSATAPPGLAPHYEAINGTLEFVAHDGRPADQPALIVNDLKLGEGGGQVALWSHATTDAYFSRLEVSTK